MMSNAVRNQLIGQTINDLTKKANHIRQMLILSAISAWKVDIKTNEPVLKHEHIVFSLSNGQTLRYHDTRKFGRLRKRKDIPFR